MRSDRVLEHDQNTIDVNPRDNSGSNGPTNPLKCLDPPYGQNPVFHKTDRNGISGTSAPKCMKSDRVLTHYQNTIRVIQNDN